MFYDNQIIEGVKLEKERFTDTEFTECEFISCIFEECFLSRCRFNDCKFVDCNIVSLKTEDSQIRGLEFKHCNLIGIHWSEFISKGQISSPIRKMSDCYLKYNTFMDMNFRKFDFRSNVIQDSLFDECDFMDSNFKGCRLERTQYIHSNMQKADFREAREYQIDIKTNKLSGARFSFPEVISLLNGIGIIID